MGNQSFFLIFFSLISLAFGQISESDLPSYHFHRFPNGLQLILSENHSNPLISTIVVVKAGSRYESAELNGAAHLLEHMTFNGTQTRTQKQLYHELDLNGIYLNAQTSEDYITFMALNHRDQNGKAVELLSDMLFHSVFPDSNFEKEKNIIIEEIRKDSENPRFIRQQNVLHAFFGNTPYGRPVIGTPESVKGISLAAIREYYKERFQPGNMVVFVAGDFDKEEIINLFRQYFPDGSALAVTESESPEPPSFPFTFSDSEGTKNIVKIFLPAPSLESDLYFPFLYFLQNILQDEEGIFQTGLKKAVPGINRIEADYSFHPGFAYLEFTFHSSESLNPAAIEKALLQQIEQIDPQRVNAADVERFKQESLISEVLQTEQIMYFGFMKAPFLVTGGPSAVINYLPALQTIQLADVRQFIENFPSLLSRPGDLFKSGQWLRQEWAAAKLAGSGVGKVAGSRIFQTVLPNGLTIVHYQSADSPVLAFHFLFRNRYLWEDESNRGIADLLHRCLFHASAQFPAEKMKARLQQIGAKIKTNDWSFIPYDDYYNAPRYSYIRFVTLERFFDEAVALTADAVQHPIFEGKFESARQEALQIAGRQMNKPDAIAKQTFFKQLIGSDAAEVFSVHGTPETIGQVSLEALTEFHRQYVCGRNLIISVVSRQDSATVISAIARHFADLPAGSTPQIATNRTVWKGIQKDSIRVGNRQSYLYFGYSFLAKTEDRPALYILNSILQDRLVFYLRETKGWAYRMGSRIGQSAGLDYFYVYVGTGKENIQPAIAAIKSQIAKFKKEQISGEELTQARNSLIAAITRRRASRENQAYFLGLNAFNGKSPENYRQVFDDLQSVSLKDLEKVKNLYLSVENYLVIYTIPAENPESGPAPSAMPPGMGKTKH